MNGGTFDLDEGAINGGLLGLGSSSPSTVGFYGEVFFSMVIGDGTVGIFIVVFDDHRFMIGDGCRLSQTGKEEREYLSPARVLYLSLFQMNLTFIIPKENITIIIPKEVDSYVCKEYSLISSLSFFNFLK